jgi:hypothetical protein
MYAHCESTLLWSIQPLPLLSLTPLTVTPYCSTAFNTQPYILYLHIFCYAILLILAIPSLASGTCISASIHHSPALFPHMSASGYPSY